MTKKELFILLSQFVGFNLLLKAISHLITLITFIVMPPINPALLDVFSGGKATPYFQGPDAFFFGQLGILAIYVASMILFLFNARPLVEKISKK